MCGTEDEPTYGGVVSADGDPAVPEGDQGDEGGGGGGGDDGGDGDEGGDYEEDFDT
jgi:hypothetical protein